MDPPYSWTRYVANSGTIKTTGVTGNAALIRTVGWGKGNTGGGSVSLIDEITPGELFLGTYESAPKYGIDFASRPRGFKFKYKYVAKNADMFIAELVVKNSDEIIAQVALDDSQKEKDKDWQEKKVIISDYTGKQATTMYIRFVSGTSTSRDDIITFAGEANLTNGENVGSQLYIDDVELIYDYE